MKLQCRWCEKLALNHSGDGISTDRLEKILFIYLVKGMIEGCAGCRLVCELLPLLNDYCTVRDDACKLAVSYSNHCFTVDTLIVLKDGTRQWMWVGDFELCKMNGK